MKTNQWVLSFAVLCLLFNGCVVITESPVSVESEKPDLIPTITVPENHTTLTVSAATATPTEEPIVETPIPTKSLPGTLTPTPTEIVPFEWDIDPYIIEDIEGVYRGVTIKGRFIVDRSLEDIVESVEISNDVFAEMIAKSLAVVWIERQEAEPWELAKPIELNKWVDLWAKAQETGSEYYWRQVQLNSIWANDLNDGNGYVEKSYIFWPMYEGAGPYGVTALHKITIVFFDTNKSSIINTEYMSKMSVNKVAIGSSVDNQDFILYFGKDEGICVPLMVENCQCSQKFANQLCLSGNLVSLPGYLMYNDGDNDIDESIGISSHIYELMKRAIKYEIKGE